MATTALDQLILISSLLHRDMERAFQGTTLTETRVHALWVLEQTGPVTQQQLVAALGTTPRSVSALVDGLERTGYVRREPHASDGRAVLVTLTDDAAEMMARMAVDHADLAARVRGAVAAEDRVAFDRGLAAIAKLLAELVESETVRYGEVERDTTTTAHGDA